MAYFSVLDLEQPEKTDVSRPGFFRDLNLDQIVERIQLQSPKYNVLKMYYRFPVSASCAEYRRKIYEDIKRPEVYECLRSFSEGMQAAAASESCCGEVKRDLQRGAWHVNAVHEYCAAVSSLRRSLAETELRSEGLQRLREYLDSYVEQADFRKYMAEADAIQQYMEDFHLILEIEDNKIVVTRGKGEGAYAKKLGYGESAKKPAPFVGTPGMLPLEEAVFEAFRRKNPEFFDRVEAFAGQHSFCADDTILRLEQEIQYYLAFFRFEEKMKGQGFGFCAPECNPERDMEAEGLYDLALACANSVRGRSVVSNDFAYRRGELFFVVGGANQGGKTTFARSVGQLVYFAEMGLDVPADRANVHYFTALMTHFSAEESLSSGKGRLKEELMRLAPMLEKQVEGAFVIINELFTTAAHYDGCIMGARVLTHFMEQRCRGIYVTHLKELGSSAEGVVALNAMLDGERRRTYKISREKMEDVGFAEDIVKKYGLTYQELSRRLQLR